MPRAARRRAAPRPHRRGCPPSCRRLARADHASAHDQHRTGGDGLSAVLGALRVPVIQAPMAGGPSTPQLSAAVCEGGGFGFLAAGYQSAAGLGAALEEVRSLTSAPFGVNLFVPGADAADRAAIEDYLGELASEAQRLGVELGNPRFDDDGWEEKLALLESAPPAVVSFTFGRPPPELL